MKVEELELIVKALSWNVTNPKVGTKPNELNKMQKCKEMIDGMILSKNTFEYFWNVRREGLELHLGDIKNKPDSIIVGKFNEDAFSCYPIGDLVPEIRKDDFLEHGVLRMTKFMELFNKYAKNADEQARKAGLI